MAQALLSSHVDEHHGVRDHAAGRQCDVRIPTPVQDQVMTCYQSHGDMLSEAHIDLTDQMPRVA